MSRKVLIDGYFINKPRGMGRYLQELLYALGRHADKDLEFVVALPSVAIPSDLQGYENIQYVNLPPAPFPIWEQLRLPHIIKSIKPDVAHFPYNTSPLIHSRHTLNIVTVHDLMFITDRTIVSGNFYQKLGNFYRSIIVKAYKWQRKFLVTDSFNSADAISKILGKESDVVYIPTEFWNASESCLSPSQCLDENYILHVGGLSPHKNTKRTIDAFLSANLEKTKLVILGVPKENPFSATFLNNDRLIFPGWVSDEQIKSFYSNALAVAFPSLAEGYGLPIVEAFSYGVPLITSDLDPMREIAGSSALLVNPYSNEEISKAMTDICKNANLRYELTMSAKIARQRMSSVRMASQMCAIYRKSFKELGE